MAKIKITQEEWDYLAERFAQENAGKSQSFAIAMDKIVKHMSKYKVIKS